MDPIWEERESISRKGSGARWISTDFQRKGKAKMKEMRTESVRVRRLSPGLVFLMVLGSKSDWDVWCMFSGGSSEISAIVEVKEEASLNSQSECRV